jgi:hypothetical protein
VLNRFIHLARERWMSLLFALVALGSLYWERTASAEAVFGRYKFLLGAVSQLFLWAMLLSMSFAKAQGKPYFVQTKPGRYAWRGLASLMIAAILYVTALTAIKIRETSQRTAESRGLFQFSTLVQAILKNDMERVRALTTGECPSSRDSLDLAPLDYAAGAMPGFAGNRGGSVEIADFLLKQGCDVNGAGKYGHTPLMYAVRSNNPELVRFLVDHGANINQVSNDGHTALFYARFDKNKPITDVLLNAGAKSEGPGEARMSDFKRKNK